MATTKRTKSDIDGIEDNLPDSGENESTEPGVIGVEWEVVEKYLRANGADPKDPISYVAGKVIGGPDKLDIGHTVDIHRDETIEPYAVRCYGKIEKL